MPTKMRWKSQRPIPDFTKSRCITVSERAKSVIEQFEPGVHQFIPVDFQYANTDKWERRYFLNVCHRIDSMDNEKATMVLKTVFVAPRNANIYRWRPVSNFVSNNEQHLIPPHLSSATKSKLVFSRAKIGNKHLWFDKFLGYGPYLSDELGAAFTTAGLTGLDLANSTAETV